MFSFLNRIKAFYPVAILPVLLLVVLSGCRGEPPLELPETPVLLERNRVALIVVEYARIHEEPDVTAPVTGHARVGEVVSVIDRTPDERWLFVEPRYGRGWIYREDLQLYDTVARARNARERAKSSGTLPRPDGSGATFPETEFFREAPGP